MKPISMLVNAVRRLDTMFPGYFTNAKHNHYADFGYPETVSFELAFRMYRRNGLAAAAVSKTVLKTWRDAPEIWETPEAKETGQESEIRQALDDVRFWRAFAEADRRSLVGGYAGVILRLRDDKKFSEPVERVAGLDGLAEMIPAWAGQLTVAEWDTDETSETYGHPKMFTFNESSVTDSNGSQQTQARAFELHPDRVVIWSEDGTVHCPSALAAGYNDLLTLEKVSGAGGEGFWKNAKSAPVFEAGADASIDDMASAMGVPSSEVADKMDEVVADWQKGFDRSLLLQGMTAKTLGITLPSPEHFHAIALQSFAASMDIPLKILVGTQTGERASTEDAREWSETCMARRTNIAIPIIREVINRFERFGILPERDWILDWSDLTASSMDEKIVRAEKMAGINQKMGLEPVFTPGEIREAVDLDPNIEGDEE